MCFIQWRKISECAAHMLMIELCHLKLKGSPKANLEVYDVFIKSHASLYPAEIIIKDLTLLKVI